jgi:transcriptional regulator with XRE-family HTH domain
MLPSPTDPRFPEALKAAREKMNLSYTEIALLCDISAPMPSRYENRGHGNFCAPSDKTWKKLNTVLSKLPESTAISSSNSSQLLVDASVPELIAALKNRGATSVVVSF